MAILSIKITFSARISLIFEHLTRQGFKQYIFIVPFVHGVRRQFIISFWNILNLNFWTSDQAGIQTINFYSAVRARGSKTVCIKFLKHFEHESFKDIECTVHPSIMKKCFRFSFERNLEKNLFFRESWKKQKQACQTSKKMKKFDFQYLTVLEQTINFYVDVHTAWSSKTVHNKFRKDFELESFDDTEPFILVLF